MPNWATGVQSLVNGWVKVNTKHVVFPHGNAEGHHDRGERESDRQLAGEGAFVRAEAGGNRQHHDATERSRIKGRDHVSHKTTTTEPTTVSSDPEAQAIRKFGVRHGRRRLQRTVSHSDLLREMVNGDAKSAPETLSHRSREEPDQQSVLMAAGFFGSNVGAEVSLSERSLPQSRPQHDQRPQIPAGTTGKYLNETMFVQQLEQSKARNSAPTSLAESESDHSSYKLPARPMATSLPLHEQNHHRQREAEVVRYDPDKFQNNENPQNGLGVKRGASCRGCVEMESRLLAAYEDVRYLRDVALRSEYNHSQDPAKPKSSMLRASHRELTTLSEASKRLTEVTARHRRQIEQMTRETSRKQHDMHFKHSKISMICKELNEESSVRKQEAVALEEDVSALKIERDNLATEVQRLRAEVSQFEQEKEEHLALRETLTQYENDALNRADAAIRARDEALADLSVRFESTMETLEIEREQQRQRRQIIFPAKSVDLPQSVAPTAKDFAALQEELRIANEAAKSSQELLEATKRDAEKKEVALLVRCENLERQLKRATSS